MPLERQDAEEMLAGEREAAATHQRPRDGRDVPRGCVDGVVSIDAGLTSLAEQRVRVLHLDRVAVVVEEVRVEREAVRLDGLGQARGAEGPVVEVVLDRDAPRVAAHVGGDLELESTPRGGTTVFVRIPLGPDAGGDRGYDQWSMRWKLH